MVGHLGEIAAELLTEGLQRQAAAQVIITIIHELQLLLGKRIAHIESLPDPDLFKT